MALQFILASSSPRRLTLLTQIGRKPDSVEHADLDETPLKRELPRALADRLALAKAQVVAAKHPNAVILAADTVVACGRRILPKAETAQEARACLALLSGRRHRVHGGIAVISPRKTWVRHVETMVRFKRLTDADIETYIQSGEWKGKAGGYAIQGLAAAYISSINGSYPNIVGLCVYTAEALLTAAFQQK
ncbi:MAG: septum formation protein Maf [Rhodospirillaceae bacterium]|nr:septum formation protein Maf [Rhodospirillaceae bacterium]